MGVTAIETAYPDVLVKFEMFKHLRCEVFSGWNCNSHWQLTACWQFTLAKCAWLVILFPQFLTCHITSGLPSLSQRMSIFKSHPHADRKWLNGERLHNQSLWWCQVSTLGIKISWMKNIEGEQTKSEIFQVLSSTEWTLKKIRYLLKICGSPLFS